MPASPEAASWPRWTSGGVGAVWKGLLGRIRSSLGISLGKLFNAGLGVAMGKGGYTGGSTKVFVGSDGTSWDSGDPKQDVAGAAVRKRWDRKSTLDAEGRAAAKAYRKLVSRFLAECAAAFCADKLTPLFPRPPKHLAKEVTNWGGNANWISKHEERTIQFAEFVKNHGWTPANRAPVTPPQRGR
jgi:hypothetical protein